jgi:hypothetical protein
MPLYKNLGSFRILDATVAALGEPSPVNHNLLAWSYDPTLAQNSSLLTNGTVYLSAVYPARTAAVTKIYWEISTAAATPTSNQNVVGLYSSAGTLLASTVVDSDITSTGLKTTTIASQTVTAGSMYWVGMVFNAGTAPTVARATGVIGVGSLINVGLTAANFRFAINGTSQTALPASITPSSNASPTFGGPWVAIGS